MIIAYRQLTQLLSELSNLEKARDIDGKESTGVSSKLLLPASNLVKSSPSDSEHQIFHRIRYLGPVLGGLLQSLQFGAIG